MRKFLLIIVFIILPSFAQAQESAKTLDIEARQIAGSGFPPSPNDAQAEFYRSHYVEILKDGAEKAEKMHPGDVIFAAQVRSTLLQKMNDSIYQEELEKGTAAVTSNPPDDQAYVPPQQPYPDSSVQMRQEDDEAEIKNQKDELGALQRKLGSNRP